MVVRNRDWTAGAVTAVGTVWSPWAGQLATKLCEDFSPREIRGSKPHPPVPESRCQSSPGPCEQWGGELGEGLPLHPKRDNLAGCCPCVRPGWHSVLPYANKPQHPWEAVHRACEHTWRAGSWAALQAGLLWPGPPTGWGCGAYRGRQIEGDGQATRGSGTGYLLKPRETGSETGQVVFSLGRKPNKII